MSPWNPSRLLSCCTGVGEKTSPFFMKHKTVSIIGAGSVGTSTAFALILKNVVPEVLMADLDGQKCKG
jgi:lactate dehydrogenase-like 2-hydroxyacid dehydrogenase